MQPKKLQLQGPKSKTPAIPSQMGGIVDVTSLTKRHADNESPDIKRDSSTGRNGR